MKTELPKKVIIGHKTYDVSRVKPPLMDVSNTQALWGEHNGGKCTIKICESLPEGTTEVEVLWHEIFHGLFLHFNLDLPSAQEEHLVDVLARGIVMVMKQNPGIVSYQNKELKKGIK